MIVQRLIGCALSACLAFWIADALVLPAGARPFTARDLVMLDRLSDVRVSPDGKLVLYSVRSTNFAANRATHALWQLDRAHPATPRRLSTSASHARWSPDGRFIYVLSSAARSQQLWRMHPNGAGLERVTALPVDVQDFRIAPDGRHFVVALTVFRDCATLICTRQRLKARDAAKVSGRIFDRVFIRHWDSWADGTNNHLFSLAYNARKPATNAVSLMRSFDGDAPSKPGGGEDDFSISPDSRTVVFSARLAGHAEPWSTNFDLLQRADGRFERAHGSHPKQSGLGCQSGFFSRRFALGVYGTKTRGL